MNYKEKIFSSLASKAVSSDDSVRKSLYTYDDPFDFYRTTPAPDKYIPITQRGVRKSFSNGLIEIEFFMEMATSLRPLIDEAQDIDEITRMFSQQKLASRPNPHSVKILRNMIKDPNPEIALYAAEGLNSIENAFIAKILILKEKIEKRKNPEYTLYYQLGKRYLDFAQLLDGQKLIQYFYIDEAISVLETALLLKKNSYTILKRIGSAWLLKNEPLKAIKMLNRLIGKKPDDIALLFLLAECFYQIKDYNSLRHMAILISKAVQKIDPNIEMVIYQWIL